jgi:signal transduction histidine kinase
MRNGQHVDRSTLFRGTFWRRDLGLQLLALYLLFVLPVVAVALIFDRAAGAQLERDVRAADLALGQSVALETDAFLQQAMDAVESFAQLPEVQSGDPAQFANLFAVATAARSDINLFYFLDAQGVMRYHYPSGPGSTVGQDFSFRQYFIDARASAGPVVSIGRVSPTTGEPVATVAQRVLNERGEFSGVVATNLALARLSDTLQAISAQDSADQLELNLSIIDAAGQIVAQPDRARLLSDAYAQISQLRSWRSALPLSRNVLDAQRREWLLSLVAIPSADWVVMVQRPTAIAFASPRAFHNGLLIAMSIFLLGGLFFWLMLSRRVIEPLERLASFSRSIGRRDDSAPYAQRMPDLTNVITRPDQMGHLTRELKRMDESIERRFAELATLLETSSATSSSLDADRVISIILEQVQRLMKVDTCALVALDRRENVLRIRASRGLSADYARELRIDPHEPRSPSMRAITTGRPVQVPDTDTDIAFEPFRERAQREGYRSLLAVPLNAPHIGPAALLVYRREPHVWDRDEIELIGSFANHAAMALENAALYRLTDEQLQEQQRVLEAVIQSLDHGLILHDAAGRVLFANRRLAESLQSTPAELEGQSRTWVLQRMCLTAVKPDEFEGLHAAAITGSSSRTFEFQVWHGGRKRDVRGRIFDVSDDDGRLIGVGELYQDITRYRELDRMKSSLISTVSHELRTPLGAIKGYATTLLQDDVEWDSLSVRQFAQVISDESDRLALLVNDLLDMSRIEAGTLQLHKIEASLADIVARAIDEVKDAHTRPLAINVPAELPRLEIDPRRVQAVVRNLLENAVKYSPAGSPIEIQAEAWNGSILVRVRDCGSGISPENRDRVFERFYRADDGYTRAGGGAGLGLAICKGFIEAHGGWIWLEDTDRGASFAFTLPLNHAEAAPSHTETES